MAKYFPPHFKSYEEYDAYAHCLSKAEVGDKVEIYLNTYRDGMTAHVTNEVELCDVVGVRRDGPTKFQRLLLLASNSRAYGFWRMRDAAEYIPMTEIMRKFAYSYWSHFDEVRIAKIIKK